MKLHNEPYELIKKGVKTIELRLYDDKRKKIKIGDTILFINTKTRKWLAVKVNALYRSESFKKLFSEIEDRKAFGFTDEGKSVGDMVSDMRAYYSEAEEAAEGVLGIGFDSPMNEIDFPVECKDSELKYVIIAALFEGKLVLCKHKKRNTLELPGGHIEAGETALDAARRELYEETGIVDVGMIMPIADCFVQKADCNSDFAYGRLFAVDVLKMPDTVPDFEMERTELYDISPYRKGFSFCKPELPSELTHFEIYSVLLYYIQRMLLNDDLVFEEEMSFYNRLKCYEEDVCVDYNSFDADEYLHYVIMRPDCEDYRSPLDRIPATEENYNSLRNGLFCSDVVEFLEVLIDKFGENRVRNDEELMAHVRKSFDKEYLDIVLG